MIGNGEDTVSSWVQMFNSICEGDDEWALAECSLLLDDCRTVEGQAQSQVGSQVHLKWSSSLPVIVREQKQKGAFLSVTLGAAPCGKGHVLFLSPSTGLAPRRQEYLFVEMKWLLWTQRHFPTLKSGDIQRTTLNQDSFVGMGRECLGAVRRELCLSQSHWMAVPKMGHEGALNGREEHGTEMSLTS